MDANSRIEALLDTLSIQLEMWGDAIGYLLDNRRGECREMYNETLYRDVQRLSLLLEQAGRPVAAATMRSVFSALADQATALDQWCAANPDPNVAETDWSEWDAYEAAGDPGNELLFACHAALDDIIEAFDVPKVEAPEAWKAGDIAKRLDITTETLATYAKSAGVATPKRGGKAHTYAPDDVLKILRYAAEHAGKSAVRDMARAALEKRANRSAQK